MKWSVSEAKRVLAAGMMGGERESLSPTLTALGPNTYLNDRDFLKMLGAAFVLHLVVIGIASLFPNKEVTNIPVRALSFKLGDQDRIAAYAPAPVPAAAAPAIAAPVMQATNERIAPQREPPKPVPVKPAKIEPAPMPKPQPHVQKPARLEPLPEEKPQPFIPLPPAIAPQPQQYVREVGQPTPAAVAGVPTGAVGGQGPVNTQTEATSREIRARYEQEISSWIQRHKLYPASAGGVAGRVVIRMRIDRGGIVRYYALEESSGTQALDAAALDMIRRANPVPAAPVNYPAGTLIEFLIPINFQAPQ